MNLVEYVEKNNKTHVIFDFDATLFLLILPWSNWFETLKVKLANIDATIWDEYERDEINFAQLQNKYIKNHGDAVRSFLNNHGESFERESLERYEPNTDLLKSLDQLSDYNKFVWSSNTKPVIEMVLEETNIAKHFEVVVSRQEVEYIKPNPAGFKLIYDGKTPKSGYLMVGDSVHDEEAAKAAGIDFYLTDFFHFRR